MASSSSASRVASDTVGSCDAPIAARPMRNTTSASTVRPRASGRSTARASANRSVRINVRASAMPVSADWLGVTGAGGACPALHAGVERNRPAAAASTRRRGRMAIIEGSP